MIANILTAALMACAAGSHGYGYRNDTTVVLNGVTISGQQGDFQQRSSQSEVQITHDYLQHHMAGSLMQTLEGIPGVKAMQIGSGQSKPAIRGLGFNRMVVSEDGIKHEGQQWGDDHGLEIDQFSIDRAEIIKGPAALLYGSDAIGGVLVLHTNTIPVKKFEGEAQLFGRSNSDLLGFSVKIGGRHDHWFYRAHATMTDYADYRVPTDSIQYYSYWIRLKDQRLRNTAGYERDGSLLVGYSGYRFRSDIRVSDSYSRSGFFANAHGLEVRLSDIDYDHSSRDVDLPCQWVNHLKVQSHSYWQGERFMLDANLAWQKNIREELSEPISHGYMPQPDGTKERHFNKDTYTANLMLILPMGQRHELTSGVCGEVQRNRRSGWGFIIPDFNVASLGMFVFDRYQVNDRLKLNGGVRYDYAHIRTNEYHDWYMTPDAATGDSLFMQRSADIHRSFNSITWSAGMNYTLGRWVLKMNAGKSFRMPIPKELGTDGINYHIFRYEQGHASLDPEESYQLDLGIHFDNSRCCLQVDPYVNYFPNYIYLNPTASYVEGLQLYHYTQARVMRYGCEVQFDYRLTPHWETELTGEYLHAEQQSGDKRGYTLPFSTPWSATAALTYNYMWKGKGFITLNTRMVGRQKEIVPPEKPTDGHVTLNLSAGQEIPLRNSKVKVALHADNLLNTRYYDHTSYYRLINVPEPGRNLSMMVGLEF